jgi:hypothetical protein
MGRDRHIVVKLPGSSAPAGPGARKEYRRL